MVWSYWAKAPGALMTKAEAPSSATSKMDLLLGLAVLSLCSFIGLLGSGRVCRVRIPTENYLGRSKDSRSSTSFPFVAIDSYVSLWGILCKGEKHTILWKTTRFFGFGPTTITS